MFLFEIHMYGVMISIGLLCCFGVLWFFEKKDKLDSKFMDFVQTNAVVAILFGFFSAALFQGIYNYIQNPERGFSLKGGITFLGGLIGGVASFLVVYALLRKKYKTRLIDILYIVPSGILIAHAFGRIGCYFGECCYGIETDSWIGIVLSNGKKVLPTHLFEAGFLFIMFGITFYLAYKKKFTQNMTLYLAAYGVWRFFIEFFRGDNRGEFVSGISPSQFWSILMVVLSIPLFFLLRYLEKKRKEELQALAVSEENISLSDEVKEEK